MANEHMKNLAKKPWKKAKEPKKTKLDHKAVFDKAREATDRMNAAQDAVSRASMVAEELEALLAEYEEKVEETKAALTAKYGEKEQLEHVYDDSLRHQRAVMSQISLLKDQLGWGKQMSEDLTLRVLDRAGGRGRRLMAASCREFRGLVERGRRAGGGFTRESRLLVIGSEGGEMEAYDEEGAKWHTCGMSAHPNAPEYVQAPLRLI